MNTTIVAIIEALNRFSPVIVQVADALGLNKLAAELVRRVADELVKAAAKTPSAVDDVLVKMVAVQLRHIADLLEQNAVKDALALLAALDKLVLKAAA